jgi:putative GTP pyrophosphokinase
MSNNSRLTKAIRSAYFELDVRIPRFAMDALNSTLKEDDVIRRSVAAYSRDRYKYTNLCDETRRIVELSFREEGIPFHIIEGRAKTVESFERKASKRNSENELRYGDPFTQITDLSGVRIITYTLKDVNTVCNFIDRHFSVVERRDVGEERFNDGKFGYQSIHFLVKFDLERVKLPEFARFFDLTCEIQVRTVLQHAWAEIEHDIQYKNQSGLPSSLQRKFIALAGLLEIADREFQAIQDEDRKLKSEIIESLQEELTKSAIGKNRENSSSENSESGEELSIRQLIRLGAYDKAIAIYDAKILESPMTHTLYLGRSKAKYLYGDRAGALLDVEYALNLQPNQKSALKLREQLEQGTSEHKPLIREASEANGLTKQGNEYLESGDGISAFEYYSRAQEAGASRPFSVINKAMACFLASDLEGAKYLIGTLEIRHGTPMSVNIVALYCLIYACVSEGKFEDEMKSLELAIDECDNFNFSLSPLVKLYRGLNAWQGNITEEARERVNDLFEYISQPV